MRRKKNGQFSCKQTLIDKRQWQFSLNFSLRPIEEHASGLAMVSRCMRCWPFVTLNYLFFLCESQLIQAKNSSAIPEWLGWHCREVFISFNMSKKIALLCSSDRSKCIIYVWYSQFATDRKRKVFASKWTQHRLHVWCWCANRFNAQWNITHSLCACAVFFFCAWTWPCASEQMYRKIDAPRETQTHVRDGEEKKYKQTQT